MRSQWTNDKLRLGPRRSFSGRKETRRPLRPLRSSPIVAGRAVEITARTLFSLDDGDRKGFMVISRCARRRHLTNFRHAKIND